MFALFNDEGKQGKGVQERRFKGCDFPATVPSHPFSCRKQSAAMAPLLDPVALVARLTDALKELGFEYTKIRAQNFFILYVLSTRLELVHMG